MKKVRQMQAATLAMLVIANAAYASPKDDVQQFVTSCIGTLPDFAKLDQSLQSTGFVKVSERQWSRRSDAAVFMIQETSDRLVCMLGLTGNYVSEFTTGITDILAEKTLGRYEQKQYQGRTLYLLQAKSGLTIIEVTPPFGATTFLMANSQK